VADRKHFTLTAAALAHRPTSQRGGAPVVALENISKRYPGTQALTDVSLAVAAGEIRALAGQNGAGKSTLIRILAGVEAADRGTIIYGGHAIAGSAGRLPIAFIHQDSGLVESMTVAENFALTVGYQRRLGFVNWRAVAGAAQAALNRLGCAIDPHSRVGELSTAERSMVATARALALKATVVVLDEPTAALPSQDVDRLFGVLRRLRDSGVGMLYVTHRLDEIFALCDSVTVLRDGRVVLDRPVSEVPSSTLVEAVAGRPLNQLFPPRPVPGIEPVLAVRDLTVGYFPPVSFTIASGEIVALVGLRGAGHEAIGRALFGVEALRSGTIEAHGKSIAAGTTEAIRNGLGFVSGRRAQEAAAGPLTVRENLFLNPSWVRASPFRWRRTERLRARRAVGNFHVAPGDPERMMATLSGGNQQKVIVARWVEADSRLLILEEPTAGVDIGAKAEIYRLIGELCGQGRACLLISSDFDEVAGLAHRALVFDRGHVVAELEGGSLSAQRISELASGSVAAGLH
jgi:ribose transport system ATP-binding protein